MPLITGTAFLIPAMLTCVLPISLLIAFATYFVRQARRLPENATPPPLPKATGATQAAVPPPAEV